MIPIEVGRPCTIVRLHCKDSFLVVMFALFDGRWVRIGPPWLVSHN